GTAFRSVVFAQVRISAINTLLTALYIEVLLRLLGIHLPLSKTLIAVTFLAGLIPIVGNLFSNTVIVIVSLTVSPQVALCSLASRRRLQSHPSASLSRGRRLARTVDRSTARARAVSLAAA